MEHTDADSNAYNDADQVALYDRINAGRWDIDHYLAVADRLGSVDVVDIGCGTGVLAVDLATRGHRATGIDPADEMLAAARSRPGGDAVSWLAGDATALPTASFDLAIMTGHVAQVFLTDDAWLETITAIHRALRPGGRLAFESRNPTAQAWLGWNSVDSRTILEVNGRRVQSWHEVTSVRGDLVTFDSHNLTDDGQDQVFTDCLRFPSADRLTASLGNAGFDIEQLCGDWNGGPVDDTAAELIYLARR